MQNNGLILTSSQETGLEQETDPEITIHLLSQNVSMGISMETGSAVPIARKLMTERRIRLTGSADGETMFDGSQDVDIFTSIETLSNEELEDLLR